MNSGSVFPSPKYEIVGDKIIYSAGLTKRELFAAMAMQGILAGNMDRFGSNRAANGEFATVSELVAQDARVFAKALIVELEKE